MLEILHPHQSMIRKNGYRLFEKIMLRQSMIRKSGYRFSEKIMLRQRRVERIAVKGACSSETGEIPGVFQLNGEGIHDACIHV
jgi:hypothetical protein